MYAPLWSPGLRQGDIVGKIFTPTFSGDTRPIGAPQSIASDVQAQAMESAIIHGESRYAMVVSHDCEFNEGKRNRVLLARIESVQGNLSPEQREALRLSNNVLARAEAELEVAGVDAFMIDPIEHVLPDESIVSFTTIFPFPAKRLGDLVALKRAELEHETRLLFRAKLAWFFGRAADDIASEERIEPPGQSGAGDEHPSGES
jgi:hypothetical protein